MEGVDQEYFSDAGSSPQNLDRSVTFVKEVVPVYNDTSDDGSEGNVNYASDESGNLSGDVIATDAPSLQSTKRPKYGNFNKYKSGNKFSSYINDDSSSDGETYKFTNDDDNTFTNAKNSTPKHTKFTYSDDESDDDTKPSTSTSSPSSSSNQTTNAQFFYPSDDDLLEEIDNIQNDTNNNKKRSISDDEDVEEIVDKNENYQKRTKNYNKYKTSPTTSSTSTSTTTTTSTSSPSSFLSSPPTLSPISSSSTSPRSDSTPTSKNGNKQGKVESFMNGIKNTFQYFRGYSNISNNNNNNNNNDNNNNNNNNTISKSKNKNKNNKNEKYSDFGFTRHTKHTSPNTNNNQPELHDVSDDDVIIEENKPTNKEGRKLSKSQELKNKNGNVFIPLKTSNKRKISATNVFETAKPQQEAAKKPKQDIDPFAIEYDDRIDPDFDFHSEPPMDFEDSDEDYDERIDFAALGNRYRGGRHGGYPFGYAEPSRSPEYFFVDDEPDDEEAKELNLLRQETRDGPTDRRNAPNRIIGPESENGNRNTNTRRANTNNRNANNRNNTNLQNEAPAVESDEALARRLQMQEDANSMYQAAALTDEQLALRLHQEEARRAEQARAHAHHHAHVSHDPPHFFPGQNYHFAPPHHQPRRSRSAREMDLHLQSLMAAGYGRPSRSRSFPAAANPLMLSLGMLDRDFDANDYEMLLRLDETVQNKQGAKPTEISSLPVRTIPEGEKVETCCICMSEMEPGTKVRMLPCMHFFHLACIDNWLKVSGVCPIDKQSVKR